MSVHGLDGRDGDFRVVHGHGLARLGEDYRELTPRRDERAADLEQIPPVARQLRLQDRAVGRARRHLRQEKHAMQLRGQLKLLHAPVLVHDGVLVLDPPEGEQLVVMINGEFGPVVSQVLHDLLVGRVLSWLVRPLEVREAVMLR